MDVANVDSSLKVNYDLFISGRPVETPLGYLNFIRYEDYIHLQQELNIISLNVLHLYYQYKKQFDAQKLTLEEKGHVDKLLEMLKKSSLLDLVRKDEYLAGAYYKVFKVVVEDHDSIEKLFDDPKLFIEYRDLILKMNMISEEEVNPNPEIQKGIEASRRLKGEGREKQTPTDIVSSVVATTSHSYDDVFSMTVLQLFTIFYRVSAIKNHDVSALFATVSSEVKLDSWSKHIDLYAKESSHIERKQFDKHYGSIMKN